MTMRVRYVVRRLDTHAKNVTFGQWCRMTDFDTAQQAFAFIGRAQGVTQRLKMFTEFIDVPVLHKHTTEQQPNGCVIPSNRKDTRS